MWNADVMLSGRFNQEGTFYKIKDLEIKEGLGKVKTKLQLFQNLIAIGIKFVKDKQPKIHITCDADGGRKIFGVQDNGIGIDPKFVDQVFLPFERLHSTNEFE